MTTAIEVDRDDPKSVRVGAVHWRLWQSSDRTCYATRGTLTEAQISAGHEATLAGESLAKLLGLLVHQPDVDIAED